jgi:hypothetical protein
MKNNMQVFQEQIAIAVLPVMKKFNDSMNGILQLFLSYPKAQRDLIAQQILMTGQFLVTTGIILAFVGHIGKLIADVALLSGKFLDFIGNLKIGNIGLLEFVGRLVATNPVLTGLVIAIGVIVTALGGWNEAFKILLNTAEIVFNGLSAGLNAAIAGWAKLAQVIVATEEGIAKALLKLPGVNKQVVQESIAWWDQLGNKLADLSNNKLVAFDKNFKNITNVITTGSGQWVIGINKATAAFGKFVDAWKTGSTKTTTSQATFNQTLSATTTDLGTLQNAMTSYSGQSVAMAKAAAALGIGLAIVNTAIGVTNRLANIEHFPWPVPAILAGIVAAAGAVQIATIASQSFAVGTDNVPYDMTANIHKGEAIIPATFADSIRKGDLTLSGGGKGGGDINIYMSGITITSKDNIRQLAEQLGFEIDRKSRNARSFA